MTNSFPDPDPCATVSLSLPDESHAGPGSSLAKLRWHLAQIGFDGELADELAAPAAGAGDKNVVEMVAGAGDAAPAALVYIVSAAAASGLVKIAGEWVRNKSKRITITATRPDGSTIKIDANNPPDNLSQLIADAGGTGEPRHDNASDD
ncbi:hypothetical protein [Actinoplanes sp. NPDC026623]|uniref:effector-associated constant component EACC1 n=1 Tax=Actinoplanes sp. NPDC026623 TaxID=3155610 RepID=UPI003401C842